ncbi:DUF3073 domain-containing protein [Gulosibacter macacae]|uniref:DUF3073 domain-containing protein n=1 Tax=Gulosibacter macacae TaxID=2488791 RepID=A0A3P3W2I6_9MICO|nr:DUF3073 domain-containing protein [Gulosibacter macacae]RRJ87043.1 DUF3073 domain-containing protein [Gulosibacter macacae]
MGRGRQKAKHTKVARELKYNIPETDYEQLQRELRGSESGLTEDEMSKWAEYIDEDDESFDEDDDVDQRRFA